METTEFSGDPTEGNDQPAADFGFFVPVTESTTAVDEPEPEPEVAQPLDQAAPDQEYATPDEPTVGLLAPEEPEPTGLSAELPMSLTIAAEEAATVDVETLAEPDAGSPYESFYSEQPATQDSETLESVETSTEAPAEVDPDFLVAMGQEPGTDAVVEESNYGLADSEAEETSYSRVSTEPALAATTSSWSTCC